MPKFSFVASEVCVKKYYAYAALDTRAHLTKAGEEPPTAAMQQWILLSNSLWYSRKDNNKTGAKFTMTFSPESSTRTLAENEQIWLSRQSKKKEKATKEQEVWVQKSRLTWGYPSNEYPLNISGFLWP